LKWRKALITFVVAATGVAPAARSAENIAEVQDFHGKILVNKGKGFEAALIGSPLKTGDRILISDKSAVTISFLKAGCAALLEKPSVFKVTKSAPCGGELISNSISGAPIAAPLGAGLGAGVGVGTAIPVVGWGATLVLTPILPASLP
jgi:hypothetical protein